MAQVSLSGLLEKIASPLRAVGALTRLNSTSPGRPSPEALPPPHLGFLKMPLNGARRCPPPGDIPGVNNDFWSYVGEQKLQRLGLQRR